MAIQLRDEVQIGLGWSSGCDVDAQCELLSRNFASLGQVSFRPGKKTFPAKAEDSAAAIRLQSDHARNDPKADKEQLSIWPSRLPKELHFIAVFATIFQGPTSFAAVPNCYLRVLNNGVEDHRRAIADERSTRTLLVAILRRSPSDDCTWELHDATVDCAAPSRDAAIEAVLFAKLSGWSTVSLKLWVVEASNLVPKDADESDPYCRVKFLDNKVYKTETVRNTTAPRWDTSKPLISYDGPVDDLLSTGQSRVVFDVFDKDFITADDFEGQGAMGVADLFSAQGRGEQESVLTLSHRSTTCLEDVGGSLLVRFQLSAS